MGEKIEFPKNYMMYVKHAKQSLSQNDAVKALHFIELAYAIKKEPNVNALYVTILVQLERYKEALDVAEDFEEMYEKEIQQNSLYLFLLIKNHRFIVAEAYLNQLKDQKKLQKEEIIQFESLLKEEMLLKGKQVQSEMDEVKRKLYSLAELGLEEQLRVVEQAIQLNESQLIAAIPFVMDNPFVNQIVKAFYLQSLISMNTDFNFRFKAFSIEKEINPSELTSFNEHPITIEVNEELDQQLEKNPSLLMSIKPEINFNLMKVYPFLDIVVTEPRKWVNQTIQFYVPDYENPSFDLPISIREKKMVEWIKKLSEVEG